MGNKVDRNIDWVVDDSTGELVGYRRGHQDDVALARVSTDASGNTVLVGADGIEYAALPLQANNAVEANLITRTGFLADLIALNAENNELTSALDVPALVLQMLGGAKVIRQPQTALFTKNFTFSATEARPVIKDAALPFIPDAIFYFATFTALGKSHAFGLYAKNTLSNSLGLSLYSDMAGGMLADPLGTVLLNDAQDDGVTLQMRTPDATPDCAFVLYGEPVGALGGTVTIIGMAFNWST